jgi:glucosyl-3-phosphoglycerate synthase
VSAALRTFHHSDFPCERLAQRRETVSVVVPARECAATIGQIAETLVDLRERGLVDQVLVVDADSSDGTGEIAARAGAEAVSENALMPQFGRTQGKGDAMWRALSVVTGDVVCFVDGDTANFDEHFACGTIGPLLFEPGVEYVKGFFRRPFRSGGEELPDDGGRVTELIARPLLRRFWPELADIRQPLAGEMAGRCELLCGVRWSVGYAVETALLLDVHREVGLFGIAQVDLDVRLNDHKPLLGLAPMADEVLAAASVRLEREGRLAPSGGPPVLERPPMATLRAAAA